MTTPPAPAAPLVQSGPAVDWWEETPAEAARWDRWWGDRDTDTDTDRDED